jgi:ribose transport system ATP-binding protein
MTAPLLSISGLHKSYTVPVLRGVNFDLGAGEVHALVGANGAGKTTLCNVVCGLTQADAGHMTIGETRYSPTSVQQADLAGIRIVMQELHLIGSLSVAENLLLTALPTHRKLIDFKRLFDEADTILRSVGLTNIDPRQEVRMLGIGQQQLLEIARALMRPCRILILDEPNAALTDPQIDLLFEKVTELKASGTGIIYISHRMNEIQEITDRVTILRDGETVMTAKTNSLTTDAIVSQMAGEIAATEAGQSEPTAKVIALRIRGLSTEELLRDVYLEIHYGEILGIAGLIGSGRTELLRAIFGADEVTAGHLLIGDDNNPVVFKSPSQAVKNGIGLIPEDRKHQGLFLSLSVKDNVTISSLHRFRPALGLIDKDGERSAVEEWRQSLDINCTSIAQTVGELSGGNQQKVSFARWLMKDCRILLFDEPTRGIDIQTRNAIYGLLRELSGRGKAIVIVSSENRELTGICDRIAVLSNGSIAAQFKRGEWSAEKLMTASFSAYTSDNAA